MAELRSWVRKILNQGSLKLKGSDKTILESPYAEFVEGLYRQRPLFFEGLGYSRASEYRNFASLEDVEVAKKGLQKLEILSRVFWKFLTGPGPNLEPSWFQNTNSSLDSLECGKLFTTAALNKILGNTFKHHPLVVKEMFAGLRTLTPNIRDDTIIMNGLINVGQRQLHRINCNSIEKEILSVFIESWSKAAADELSLLVDRNSVDPHAVQMVILR